MEFWTLAVLITVLVAAPLAWVLLRRRSESVVASDVDIYRDQLAEVERDRNRGVLSAEEAERLKLEVSRRLLEAGRQARAAGGVQGGASPLLAGLVLLVLFGGGFFIYSRIGAPLYPDLPLESRLERAEDIRNNRISQAEAEAQLPTGNLTVQASPRHLELMEKLREALKNRPDDLQGFILLARNEAALENFVAARKAQERVLELKGEQATAADWADYADILVLAAGGYVSPEAERALRKALELESQNGVARYYLGLMHAQTGRPDLAFQLWADLLESSQPEAPWVPVIRAQIETVAREAGVRYTLPPLTAGPSQDDIAAAQELTEEERQEMIRGMVAQLGERLAAEGGSPEEWAQFIRALGVLGETERAASVWGEAQQVFAASPEALETLRAAARTAGVAE